VTIGPTAIGHATGYGKHTCVQAEQQHAVWAINASRATEMEGGGGGAAMSEQQKWNNIAWALPVGQTLRGKIEAIMARLKPEQALLEAKSSRRDSVRHEHIMSVQSVEQAQAVLTSLGARKGEMDLILGEVQEQLEQIKKALLKLTKTDLDQLRRMPDPSVPIRRTFEMVYLILNAPSISVSQVDLTVCIL